MDERPGCGWQLDIDEVCQEDSRFRVERADGDSSYLPEESCAAHLGDTIAILLEGLLIAAIVTVHWDEGEAVPRG